MNRNDPYRPVTHGEPSLAINHVRRCGVAIDAGTGEELCGSAVLSLACGVGEVLNSFLVVREHRQSTRMAHGSGDQSGPMACCDG
jgi:hypothetical protein